MRWFLSWLDRRIDARIAQRENPAVIKLIDAANALSSTASRVMAEHEQAKPESPDNASAG